MTYDEAQDFVEKRGFISDLLEYLADYKAQLGDWHALEIGGGGGVLSGLLGNHLGHIVSTDLSSPLLSADRGQSELLSEKFARNGEVYPASKVEFLRADAQKLPFRDHWFDFCFSQNAFEHIPDPEQALRELVRVTRPGGLVYFMFDPVWSADSGSHFLHLIGQPWAHLIEDDDAIAARMRDGGASEEEIGSYRSEMNRLPVAYYREMFPRVIKALGVEVVLHHEWSGCVDPTYPNHPNFVKAAEATGLAPTDLLLRGMRYLLKVKNYQ